MRIVEKRVIYIAISVVLILAGIIGMIVNAGMGNGAFSTDVEFSGGTSIEVKNLKTMILQTLLRKLQAKTILRYRKLAMVIA